MFKCEGCKQDIGPSIHPIKTVTQKRNVTYNNGSKGWEIVKEVNLCSECRSQLPVKM